MADLADEFENEVDLADAFENEADYVEPNIAQKVGTSLAQSAQNAAPIIEDTQGFLQSLGTGALDAARGIGKGLTMNSIDEVGGALSAGAEALYNQFNPTDVGLREQGFNIAQPSATNLYTQNQQAIQKELEMSAERSPVLDIAGQIGGGMASGSIVGSALGLGAGAQASKPLLDVMKNQGVNKAAIELLKRGGTTYAKALPAIAAEGALSSKEGNVLTPEGRSKLAEDAVGAAAFGLPVALGLQGITDVVAPAVSNTAKNASQKIKDVIKDSPLLRQMKVAYGYGEQGINPRSTSAQLGAELGKTNLAELDNSRVKKLMDEIYRADEKIGKAVGESIEKATQKGTIVDISGDTMQSLLQLQNLAKKYPELSNNTRVSKIYEKIASDGGKITPSETQELIKYVDSYANKFQGTQDVVQKDILKGLLETRKAFSNKLKESVPEYAEAASRMTSFRQSIPETIIARSKPREITNDYFGNLKDKDEKLFDSLKSLVQGTTKPGASATETRTAYVNTMKGMKKFEAEEAERLANGKIKASIFERPVDEIGQEIQDASDDAVARGAMDALTPQTGAKGVALEAVSGFGAETGRSVALGAANRAGMISRRIPSSQNSPVAKLGRNIYNAPDDAVKLLATTLEGTPGLENYGKKLTESINSGNSNRRNQVLFTIMQNPAARAVVGTDEDEE